MSTELMIPSDNMSFDDYAAQTGFADESNGSLLQRLRVNYDFETDDGKALKPGTWAVFDTETRKDIFSKEVLLRPFFNLFQYAHYDPEENKVINKTVLEHSIMNGEFIDELGTKRCGRVTGVKEEDMSPEQIKLKQAVKANRIILGTLTMEGADVDGNVVTLADYPCLWRSRGSAWKPVDDALKAYTAKKHLPFQYPMHMTLQREKNGSVTYYVPVIVTDFTAKPLPLSDADKEVFKEFAEFVKIENDAVKKKHNKALKTKQTDPIEDADAERSLEEDFDVLDNAEALKDL